MRIGIVGGTGREGRGLAIRLARAGHAIAIGSRDAERARARAAELAAHGAVAGGENAWAVEEAEVVWLCVPYAAHAGTLRGLEGRLAGRVLVDLTVPLAPPAVHKVQLPAGGAAALEAQAIVGPRTPVVSTLHHVSSAHLAQPGHELGDVLLAGDDEPAKALVGRLVAEMGGRPLDAGPLENAIALESMTPVLIHLTRKHKSAGAGLRVTGLP